MLQIRVVSVAGQPPATPIVAQFGPAGGSIGRNEGNTLVLPDEAKTISRQHALIQMQGQGYVLLDKGANPTLRNRVPVGAGQVVPLEPGDELCIGPYVLTVERPAAAAFDPNSTQVAPAPVAPVPPSASALVRGLMRESATVSYSAEALRGAWDYPLVSREQEVNRPAQHISK